MFSKIKYLISATLILVAFISVETHSQSLSGVWSGKYNDHNATFKFEIELSYDQKLKLYVGQSKTKRTSYNPNDLFPTSETTYLVAHESGDSLLYNEIAADVPPKSNMIVKRPEVNVDNWKFVGGIFIHSNKNAEEQLTGFMQHWVEAKIPITLSKTESKPSEKTRNNMLEALTGLQLSFTNYKASDGSNKIYENSSGELFYSVTNSSKFIFKDIVSFIYFDQKPSGVTIQGKEWIESGVGGNMTYMDGQSKNDKFIFSTNRDIPEDSLSGILCIQTRNKIILQQQRFSMPTVKLVKKLVKADTDWNSNERSKLIASYYGINKYSWNIKNDLEKLVEAGDKKALMWKTLFMYLGQAGYETDEQMAFSVGSEKGLFSYLVEQLKAGDVESMFLTSVALMMNLAGSHYQEDYEYLLVKAAESNYAPAQYALGLKRLYEKKYNDSKYFFQKALDNGVKIANIQLGMFDENGWKVPVNTVSAISYYRKAALMNNPDALMRMAEINATGMGVLKDNNKALEYLKQAVETGSSAAKLALADFYLKNKTNKSEIFSLTKQAADSDNRDAIFQLGLLYTYPEMCGIAKDPIKATEYLKKAAELGQAHAMNLLGLNYFNGIGLEKDNFRGRFWLSEAATRGVGEGVSDKVTFGQPLMAFFQGVCSYVPDIIVETTYYGDGLKYTEEKNDPNPIPYLFEGVKALYNEVHQQRQPTIDDFRLIYKRGNIYTSGGIMTTGINLTLRKNYVANVYASGKISLGTGTVLQNIGPDGMAVTGEYRYYSVAQSLPHGCIIASGDLGDTWGILGKSATGIQVNSGYLKIAVNDVDYINNQGYFNLRVDVIQIDSSDKNEISPNKHIASPVGNSANVEIKDKSKTSTIDISTIKYKRPEDQDLSKGHLASIKNNSMGTFFGLNNSQAISDSDRYQWLIVNISNSNCFYLIDPKTGLYLTANKKGGFTFAELPEDKSIWQNVETNYKYRIRNINRDEYLQIENGSIVCGKLKDTWKSAIWEFVY